jgi:spermidine/putrescine-binding protein
MNKKLFLMGILGIALVFGLVLVGCDKDDGDSNKGTLTIYNSSGTTGPSITKVEIYTGSNVNDIEVTDRVVNNTVPIAQGANKSWSLAPSGYVIVITVNGNTLSKVVNVAAGATVDATYDGNNF